LALDIERYGYNKEQVELLRFVYSQRMNVLLGYTFDATHEQENDAGEI
jgi:hypothetical protein